MRVSSSYLREETKSEWEAFIYLLNREHERQRIHKYQYLHLRRLSHISTNSLCMLEFHSGT